MIYDSSHNYDKTIYVVSNHYNSDNISINGHFSNILNLISYYTK